LTSPLIKERLGVENGTIKGKGGVGKWWKRVLDKIPDLKTEFIAFAESIDSVVLVQKISLRRG
jgi:hypothetical protein